MNTLRLVIFLVIALVGIRGAIAQNAFDPTYPITPYLQPSWFVPSESGSGFLFGRLPNTTTLFGAYYTYTAGGQSSWLVFQGPYVATSDAERIATGVIGRASSPLYEAMGGPCLTCPYTAPTVQQSALGQAEIVFTNSTSAEFHVSTANKALVPLDTATVKSVPDVFVGTFSGTLRVKPIASQPIQTLPCQIALSRTSNPTEDQYERASAAVRVIPTPGSTYLKVVPAPGAPSNNCVSAGETYIIIDPNTGAARLYFFDADEQIREFTRLLGYRILAGAIVADVYLVSPDRIVWRGTNNTVGNTGIYSEAQVDRVVQ